jgi:hypothetical protein
MYLRGIGFEVVDLIYLAQDKGCWLAFVKMVMNLQVHRNLCIIIFSRRLCPVWLISAML